MNGYKLMQAEDKINELNFIRNAEKYTGDFSLIRQEHEKLITLFRTGSAGTFSGKVTNVVQAKQHGSDTVEWFLFFEELEILNDGNHETVSHVWVKTENAISIHNGSTMRFTAFVRLYTDCDGTSDGYLVETVAKKGENEYVYMV
ncbi:MAG: hypothetical protein IKI37_11085 [Oscillospiraceae bacterium]|nr:hypothetical protein [Oscillospiraceae bacterium]